MPAKINVASPMAFAGQTLQSGGVNSEMQSMRFVLSVLILAHMAAFALDKDQEQGLEQTKELLRDPKARQDRLRIYSHARR